LAQTNSKFFYQFMKFILEQEEDAEAGRQKEMEGGGGGASRERERDEEERTGMEEGRGEEG
jgi:hypothetical protein